MHVLGVLKHTDERKAKHDVTYTYDIGSLKKLYNVEHILTIYPKKWHTVLKVDVIVRSPGWPNWYKRLLACYATNIY